MYVHGNITASTRQRRGFNKCLLDVMLRKILCLQVYVFLTLKKIEQNHDGIPRRHLFCAKSRKVCFRIASNYVVYYGIMYT